MGRQPDGPRAPRSRRRAGRGRSRLEALQQEGAGAGDELRAATRTRRVLLDQLTDVAASYTERPDTSRSAIAATLDAASLDPELRDDLARGRLTTELSPAVRFGDLGDLGGLGDGDDDGAPAPRRRAPACSPRKSSTPPPRDDLAVRRAETALNEAHARATATDDELRDVEAETRDAEDALDAARPRRRRPGSGAGGRALPEVKGLQRRATELEAREYPLAPPSSAPGPRSTSRNARWRRRSARDRR